jgi:hypothetical protein
MKKTHNKYECIAFFIFLSHEKKQQIMQQTVTQKKIIINH